LPRHRRRGRDIQSALTAPCSLPRTSSLRSARFGVYSRMLLAMIAECMIALRCDWRVRASRKRWSRVRGCAGASIACWAIRYVPIQRNNVNRPCYNPLETIADLCDANTTDVANHGSSLSRNSITVLDGVAFGSGALTASCCILSGVRPCLSLDDRARASSWRGDARETSWRSRRSPLLMDAIGIEGSGVRRGLKSEYFIFTDP